MKKLILKCRKNILDYIKEKRTKSALETLRKYGYFFETWNKEDIKMIADEFDAVLTDEQMNKVVDYIEATFESSVGINKEVIRTAIERTVE